MGFEESVPIFWRRIASHYRLSGTKCVNAECNKIYFPPRRFCPECNSATVENIILSGKGKILTHTTIFGAPPGKELQTPYSMAIIQLEEGPRITGQVVGCDVTEVKIGMLVKATFRKYDSFSKQGVIHYGYKFIPAHYPKQT